MTSAFDRTFKLGILLSIIDWLTFNIVFSIAVKLVVLMLGLWDLVSLWLAVFADVGVMLIAVGIAMLSRAKVR